MKITILADHINEGSPDTSLALKLKSLFEAKEHSVFFHVLESKNIHNCRGCFDCWVKTPGECVYKDDMEMICRDIINSSLLLVITSLKMGFTDAVLKKVQERMIPLLHPYMSVINGEMHHSKRYENYPLLAVVVKTEADTDDEDLHLVRKLFERFALNFMTELVVFATEKEGAKMICEEICSYQPVKL